MTLPTDLQAPIRSTFADDPDMLELVEIFVDGVPEKLSTLENALANNSVEALRVFSHQLKGSAGGYGFDSVSALAAELEQACKSNQLDDELRQLVDCMRQCLQAIRV